MPCSRPFAETAAAVNALDIDAVGLLSDDALLAANAVVAAHRSHVDALAALLAGEIHRRSPRDAGYSGLAQRNGFGSAEKLLQATTRVTKAQAVSFVQVGRMLGAATTTLWEAALARAVTGGLAIACADAIAHGLAQVAETARATELEAECLRLIARASSVSADELRREARSARDRLDEAGIARREFERHDMRYVKYWVRDDGMYGGSFLLDPESGQRVFGALNAIVAPRRGVRFRDTAAANAVIDDPRTTQQLLADALVDIIQVAVDADPGTLFGGRRPGVRVVVTEETLASAGGHGYLEGDSQPVSRETIDRFVCDTGTLGIKFNRTQQVIDLGRTQRLFTQAQRVTISVRDGACLFPECEIPPSRCEVHHIIPWKKHGRTDVRDGVLLGRHHHMLLHTRRWNISRERDRYWLHRGTPSSAPLVTKSPLMRELVT